MVKLKNDHFKNGVKKFCEKTVKKINCWNEVSFYFLGIFIEF